MNVMSFSKVDQIFVLRISEPFETLVDKHFVESEVYNAVQGDPESSVYFPIIQSVHHSEHDQQPAWDGEKEEEEIV